MLVTVSFKTTFNFSTKKFNFEDTTDYVGQSIDSADVRIVFNITDPLGNTLYNNPDFNNPDISPSVSVNNNLINLLLDSDGNVVQGQYVIVATYKVLASSLLPEHTVQLTTSPTLNYTAPTINIQLTANCVTPLLKSNDLTEYRVTGVLPTISRVHTVFYPAVLQLSDIVGTGQIVQTSTFYTQEHSSKVVSTLTYNFTSYFVADVIEGTASLDVVCDAQLCDIYCCIAAEFGRYLSKKSTNPSKANEHLNNWMKMMSAAGQIGIALECGKDSDVNNLTDFILTLGNCQTGCGCQDGAPVPVVGLGGLGSGNTVVDTCGNGITVTSATVGGVTTYTVCLSTAIATKINNLFNTTVVAGSNIIVTSTADVNGNIQYTVAGVAPAAVDMMTLLLELTFFQNQIATLSIIHSEITGTIFKEPTTKIVNSGLGFAGWQLKNNAFKLKEFLNSAINFKSVMSINKWQYGNPKVGDLVITSEGTDQMLVSEIIAIDPGTDDGTLVFTIGDGSVRGTNEELSFLGFKFTISLTLHL